MMDRSHFPIASTVKLLTAPPVLRQPVSLEVPVRVQGDSADRAAFFEDTNTVLVFAEGAVLRIGGHLQPGQTLLLTNRSTRQQIPCRVSLVKQHGTVRGYAEVEFAQPAPNFWQDAPGLTVPHTYSASPAAFAAVMPAVAPAATLRAAESFAQVDNIADSIADEPQVNVFQAAAAPAISLPGHGNLPTDESSASSALAAMPSPILTPTPPAVDEIEQLLAARRGETDAQAQEAARAASDFAAKLLQPPEGAPIFVAALPVRRSRRGWAIGAVAIALLLTLGTSFGGWGGLAADAAKLVPPAPLAPPPPHWAVATAFSSGPSLGVLPLRTPRTRLSFPISQPASLRRSAEVRRALLGAGALAPAAVNRRDVGDEAQPEVSTEIPAVSGTALALLPTAPNVPAPVIPLESKLEPLRLVYSAKPVYPSLARRARTEGEVVIHARVDEAGKVTAMRVISGPPALRQAALDALQQWKYEPARLNGKPVVVDTAVTIKFAL